MRWLLFAFAFTFTFTSTFTLARAWADTSAGTQAAREILLEYVAPTGQVDDLVTHYTEWKAGDRLFRIDDGRPEVVAEPKEGAIVAGFTNRWYRLASGERLFGGQLTPFRFLVDFDGDGKPELATVSFGADFQIHVRIGSSEVLLKPAGSAYLSQLGGNATAHLETVLGVPMLKVGSHPEACSDYFDAYVSYAGGKAKNALELDGLADPPVHSTPTVRFDARTNTAVVTQTNSEEDAKGRTHAKKTVTRYHFIGSVFRK